MWKIKGFSSFFGRDVFLRRLFEGKLDCQSQRNLEEGRERIQTNPLLSPSQHQPYFSLEGKPTSPSTMLVLEEGVTFFFFFWLLPPLLPLPLSVSTSSFPFPFPPFPQEKNIPPPFLLLLLLPPPPPHSQDKKEELDNWRIAKKQLTLILSQKPDSFFG